MGKYIVIIDSSKTIQIILYTFFRNAGHLAVTHSSTLDALHSLEIIQDIPDVIFIMIDIDGRAYDFIRTITASPRYARTQIVAMVLQEEKARIQKTLGNNTNIRYLVKPFLVQEALALVSEIPREGKDT